MIQMRQVTCDSVIVDSDQIHILVFHLLGNALRDLGDNNPVQGEKVAGGDICPLQRAPALLVLSYLDVGTPILFASTEEMKPSKVSES
jgi:hypothetical protein